MTKSPSRRRQASAQHTKTPGANGRVATRPINALLCVLVVFLALVTARHSVRAQTTPRIDYILEDLRAADFADADLTEADLALANLTGADLARADLSRARLEAATLTNADLAGARLAGADLSLADLRGATLRDADLTGAILTAADLRRADLQGANLTGAILNNANLEEAVLAGARLTNAVYDAHTVWPAGFDPSTRTAGAGAAAEPTLRVEMSVSPSVLPVYNAAAHPDDIARVDHPRDIALLADVTTGQRMAVFKSAALAAQLAPRIAHLVDIIGYNLEHGPFNPLDEQADPVAAVRALRQVLDAHDLALAIGPDHDFARSHGAALAPLADQFVLQIQRVQTQPEVATAFVREMSAILRAANPAVEISAQIRTDGEPAQVAALIADLSDQLDGVAILTRPDGADEAQALLAQLRASPAPDMATSRAPEAEPVPSTTPASPRWRALWLGLGLELLLVLAILAAVAFIAAGVAVARSR